MAAALVIDSSVTLSLAFADEFDDFSLRAFDAADRYGALVPYLWSHEVPNILHSGVKRGRITKSDARRFLALLADMPIEIVYKNDVHAASIATELFSLAEKYDLTSYDAAYLQLSITSGLPLASKDKQLNAAAQTAGIQLFA